MRMIIEFELQGSRCLHKGLFETTGFWVKFEPEVEGDAHSGAIKNILGYKIYSHFSFSFYHEDYEVAHEVYRALCSICGEPWGQVRPVRIKDIGYIKRLGT